VYCLDKLFACMNTLNISFCGVIQENDTSGLLSPMSIFKCGGGSVFSHIRGTLNTKKNSMTSGDCEVCQENPAKYKCPACAIATCSLSCVQRHKRDRSCTGKRPRSEQVSIKDFTDSTLVKGT
jgi:hypothetical protein